jgi:hypothetical protein
MFQVSGHSVMQGLQQISSAFTKNQVRQSTFLFSVPNDRRMRSLDTLMKRDEFTVSLR